MIRWSSEDICEFVRGKETLVVFLDLDGFTTVNDVHGHDVRR